MSERNSYRPVIIGGVVAALVIGAFFIGFNTSEEADGPAETLGESLDNAAQELKEGVEKSTE